MTRVQFHTEKTQNSGHRSFQNCPKYRSTTETSLTRVSFAKNLDGCGHFLLTDSFILLSLGSGLEALPGEGAQVEVHEDITERLQVITSGLLCGQKVSADKSEKSEGCDTGSFTRALQQVTLTAYSDL